MVLKAIGQKYLDLNRVYSKEQFFLSQNEHPGIIALRAIHLHATRRALDLTRYDFTREEYWKKYSGHYRATLVAMVAKNECQRYLSRELLWGHRFCAEDILGNNN